MAEITGGRLVAKALKSEGVDTIFTLCGGHITEIYNGCLDEGIRIIDVRHEQVAAHAADGYARVTGKPGVAVVTAGPGVTDAVTGVANAFRAESPMLLIGGQGALSQTQMGSLQELPHTEILRPITKFSATVPRTERVADLVSMAFRQCYNGALGPSFLEIPRDVLDATVDEAAARVPEAGRYRSAGKSIGDPRDVERLAELLTNAERPAVLLGTQLWSCRGHLEAKRLAETLNAPMFMNGAARGALTPDDPFGFMRARRYAFNKADVIVIVGTPFDFRMGYGNRLRQEATIVQIDMDYGTVGKNRDIDLGLVGDVGAILGATADAAARGVGKNGGTPKGNDTRKAWLQELRAQEGKLTEEALAEMKSAATPIHPARLCYEIDQFLTEDSVYVGDGGDIVTFSGSVVRPRRPGHWMDPGPLGTLGVGIAFAMASKLTQPEKEVVALFGDGAFSLTGWDFETMVRFNLPFVGVVGNNAAWNQIRGGQLGKYGPERSDVANLLSDVRFDQFATMLGGYGEHVEDPEQIAPALQRARESGKPSLINVKIDREQFSSGTRNQTMYK